MKEREAEQERLRNTRYFDTTTKEMFVEKDLL